MNDWIQQSLEVLSASLLSVDNLKFGRKFWQSKVNIFEIHLNNLIEGLELTIAFETPDSDFIVDEELHDITLSGPCSTLCLKISLTAPTTRTEHS